MPPFQSDTGNKTWDQNISTLGQALFPDPSKAGQAYYYGTQSRKALLESNLLNDKLNARARFGMMGLGGPQPAPPTYIQPSFPEGAAPYMAPPSNLPYADRPAQPGPTSAPMHTLATIASGTTPGQVADLIEPAVQARTVGTPAPVGPPSAVSPAAPQTTTNNGQVPPRDIGSGDIHPQSLNNSAGTQASPATATGSPAQLPPGMTLPGLFAYTNAGALADINPQNLQAGGQALAYTMFERGLINETQLMRALGSTGQAGPWQQTISTAGGVQQAQIQAGATRYGHDVGAATAAARLAEDRRQYEAGTKPTVDETGRVVYTPIAKLPGQTYYEPTVAATVAGERTRQAGETGIYMDPANPGRTIQMTKPRAIELGLQPAPATLEGAQAPMSTAIFGAQTPAEAAPLMERRDRAVIPPAGKASETTAAPPDSDELAKSQDLMDKVLQNFIPADPKKAGGLTGASSPALGYVFRDLTNQYVNADPTRDRYSAAQAAYQQMVRQKYIVPGQTRARIVTRPGIDPNTKLPVNREHFQVDLHDPATLQPYQEGAPLPRLMMDPGLASTMAPASRAPAPRAGAPAAAPAAAATPPSGTVIRPAAPGIPEGELGNGGKYIVRGGNWVVR